MKLTNSIAQLASRLGRTTASEGDFEDFMDVSAQWTPDEQAATPVPVPDRVLSEALSHGLIAERAVPESGSWRDLASSLGSMAGPLYETAARIYGYRAVLVCEMSSIVQADLLSVRFTPETWHLLFDNGLVPVVEHGTTPDPDHRVLLATHDPTNRDIRRIVDSIRCIRPDIVYADASVVTAIQTDIAQCVEAVGAVMYAHQPKLKKVVPIVDTPFGRAA